VRLRLSRRSPGAATTHNSRYGPQNAPKITTIQRDAVCQQILDRLSNAGGLALLVEQNELGGARRLARELADDLQLVLDVLGWSETGSGGPVELDLPAEQLRRTFARLRERAVEQREASWQEPATAQTAYERALIVIDTCNQVLAVIGGDTQAAA
jgi:hypothetical protein